MQIVQVPFLPQAQSGLPAQNIPNVLPAVHAQAVQPISTQAVAPPPKSEAGNHTRPRDEEDEPEKENGKDASGKSESEKRGGHVNISV